MNSGIQNLESIIQNPQSTIQNMQSKIWVQYRTGVKPNSPKHRIKGLALQDLCCYSSLHGTLRLPYPRRRGPKILHCFRGEAVEERLKTLLQNIKALWQREGIMYGVGWRHGQCNEFWKLGTENRKLETKIWKPEQCTPDWQSRPSKIKSHCSPGQKSSRVLRYPQRLTFFIQQSSQRSYSSVG